jgi:hypothetical protein
MPSLQVKILHLHVLATIGLVSFVLLMSNTIHVAYADTFSYGHLVASPHYKNDTSFITYIEYGPIMLAKNGSTVQDITINGTVREPSANSPVLIRVYYPDGSLYKYARILPQHLTPQGSFQYEFGITQNQIISGEYNVVIFYNGQKTQTPIHQVVPPGPILSRPQDDFKILDNSGQNISQIKVGQQVQVVDKILQMWDDTSFVHVVQIINENQSTVSLSWLAGQLGQNQSMTISQTWTPFEPGNYTVNIFMWKSLAYPYSLYPPLAKTVEVR